MKRTVKHRDTELCLKLKETQFRLLLFKMCPGHPSANKIAKTSPSVDGFLRRLQCSGKGYNLPKEKGHKKEKPLFGSAFPHFCNVSSHTGRNSLGCKLLLWR